MNDKKRTQMFPDHCNNGDLRLMGGSTRYEGRVELCWNETWGTICDGFWSTNDANVACRQLGFLDTGNTISMYIGFTFRVIFPTQSTCRPYPSHRVFFYLQNRINNYKQTIKSTVCVNYDYATMCNTAAVQFSATSPWNSREITARFWTDLRFYSVISCFVMLLTTACSQSSKKRVRSFSTFCPYLYHSSQLQAVPRALAKALVSRRM